MKKKIAIVVLIIVGAVLLSFGFYMKYKETHAGEEYDIIREAVVIDETPQDTIEATKTPAPVEKKETAVPTKEPVTIPIDFAALKAINDDIYAWIKIPNTNIDYPVVQSIDNTFYLNHGADGEARYEGAIFTENYNSKTFEDPHTVLYGHNMANGSMFQNLHKYEDETFFNDNKEVIIYTANKILHYNIFAAYVTDDQHLLAACDMYDTKDFQRYLDSISEIRQMNAHIDPVVKLEAGKDKIITLSTCVSGYDSNQRYLVQAVLVSIEE